MNSFLECIRETIKDDRLLHFFIGAWIVASLTPFKWSGVLGGFILVMALEYIKEFMIDTRSDWYDVLATFLGCLMAALLYAIIFFSTNKLYL